MKVNTFTKQKTSFVTSLLQVLETFLSSTDSQLQSDLLMVNYLQCGDLLDQTNHCLELLVCSYTGSTKTAFSKSEKDVVSM